MSVTTIDRQAQTGNKLGLLRWLPTKALGHRASRSVDDQPHTSQVIRNDPVRRTGSNHVVRHVDVGAVDVALEHVA